MDKVRKPSNSELFNTLLTVFKPTFSADIHSFEEYDRTMQLRVFRQNIPEDCNLHGHHGENLKSKLHLYFRIKILWRIGPLQGNGSVNTFPKLRAQH
jgi:hypothetical protein